MSHIGCKHLDYETNYENCKIVTIKPEGWKYWERGKKWTEGSNPKDVQFCKKRGRINSIFQCINPGEMSCYEAQTSHNKSPELTGEGRGASDKPEHGIG